MKINLDMKQKPLIALLTNNDDDVYCFRKELIEGLIAEGYEMLVSCPDGPKFELMRDIPFIYDNPDIDRRGTNPVKDFGLLMKFLDVALTTNLYQEIEMSTPCADLVDLLRYNKKAIRKYRFLVSFI